ncbi:MAG: 2-oxoacid:ferredoxin oxidoreductase subunit beta, partial [Bacteroidales bacterium]|nr:2-oxoacid:ferredoxin oxidoreductase subunit beta [Bacteroidales bacterium]
GNHFIHAIRRNIDINIILFNNEIYGLTKGQYSPTSKLGSVTKTSPYGTVEHPFHPGELVIGAQGKFFARSIDSNIKLCQEIFIDAGKHHGATVVEVLQNCIIYNDKTHAALSDRKHKEDRTIVLQHGEPMIFGKNKDKGLILDAEHLKLKVVELGEKYSEKDLLKHNAEEVNPGMHLMIANMAYPEYPVAFGVIRNVKAPTYDGAVQKQVEEVKSKSPVKSVDDLLNSGTTWKV